MSMTKKHFEEKQELHSVLVKQIVDLIRSNDFILWCRNIHNSVKYDELASDLEKFNKELMDNQTNIVEWYLKCQQLNADIVANLLSSIASQLTEKVTEVPVIKQLVYLIDQLVIAGLNCAHYVLHHGRPSSEEIVERKEASWPQKWYQEHIKPSFDEIKDAFHSIRLKHDTKESLTPAHKRLSTLSAAVTITASLIKLQAHIVTGLLTVPAKLSGNVINDVIEKIQPHSVVLFLGNMIKELIKVIVKIPIEAEAVLLKQMQNLDRVFQANMQAFEKGIDDTQVDEQSHFPVVKM